MAVTLQPRTRRQVRPEKQVRTRSEETERRMARATVKPVLLRSLLGWRKICETRSLNLAQQVAANIWPGQQVSVRLVKASAADPLPDGAPAAYVIARIPAPISAGSADMEGK